MKNKALLAALALLAFPALPTSAYEISTISVGGRPTGDPLGPQLGTDIDWSVDSPRRWYLNEVGQVAFTGRLAGVDAAADTGLWRYANGAMQLLGREGVQASPLPNGALFDEFSSVYGMSISNDGSILFSGFLTGAAIGLENDESYMLAGPDGTISVLAREGDQASGFNALTRYQPESGSDKPLFRHDLAAPQLSPDGRALIPAVIGGPGVNSSNNHLLYAGQPGALQVIAREGQAAPGVTPGATFGQNVGRGFFATAGPISLSTDVTNPDSSTTNVIYRYDASGFTTIAAQGALAGLDGRVFTGRFGKSQVNAAGDVAFTANLSGTTAKGLFKASAGSVDGAFELLAGPGLAAPGTIASFSDNPGSDFLVDNVLTQSGSVAFLYDLTGPGVDGSNDRGIWVSDSGTSQLALREGDAAVGLSGATIGTLREFTFNDNHQLIVISNLAGAVSANNDSAMWHVLPNGELQLLLREGDLYDVDPTANVDARTISSIRLGGYLESEGLSRYGAFNGSDQLAFSLSFTDGTSGLFLADVTPVPEPHSMVLLIAGMLACRAFKHR